MILIDEMIETLQKIRKEKGDALYVTCNRQGAYSYLVFKEFDGRIVDCKIIDSKMRVK